MLFLFIRFTVRAFRWRLPMCECASLPFGSEDRIWDLVSIYYPYICLPFSFS